MAYAVEGHGLEKTFIKKRSLRELMAHPFSRAERIHALRGVDLSVKRGEIFGLLGPNGAGKTTLLKIFCCLVLPDVGQARVGGEDTVYEQRVKPQIGLVHSDERSFYWRLSARENLRFFARLYDVPGKRINARIQELLERVDLADAADRPFAGYSSGMKQRVAIARSLLHDPPILMMDEPTRSLDPATTLELRAFIHDELSQREGKTILLATHNLREAEALSHRLAILVRGRVRQIGTVDAVRRWGLNERRLSLELKNASGPLDGPFRIVKDETADGLRRLTVTVERDLELGELLQSLMQSGVTIHACDRLEPDLEEAFSRIVAADRAEQAAEEDGNAS